jgi:hypothetical protein
MIVLFLSGGLAVLFNDIQSTSEVARRKHMHRPSKIIEVAVGG